MPTGMSDLEVMERALDSQRRILLRFWRVYPLVVGLNVMVVISGGSLWWFVSWAISVAVCGAMLLLHTRQQRIFSRASRGER